ncbi:aldo/keto reductase [Luteimicrobium subarcticum]|uniref:D-threo-aldose 1-dehydrogenase n=1 Tax=Luteimicrobium subarcticum TaxID=620910 RepID=A0A2M8WJA9_9MICO|nr:aldo/keto reductase [Luteimicrobium subarcticum]PJI91014.1 D-threo-aldose 1-dehydrogenase [Luteimicrobium subarcticum]
MRHVVLGPTGLVVPEISVGAATWWDDAGVPVETSDALARRVLSGARADDPRYLDTSNNYGAGESERRIGRVLRSLGGVPDGATIQTKADRDMATGDFSGTRVRRSLEESMERLGVDRLPLVFLHDPENVAWNAAWSADGAVAALVAARDEGIVGHLGISGGPVGMLADYVRTGVFDVLITHNRWTLVDRGADALLTLARDRGLGVLNAAPYGGGMLTRWPLDRVRYAYGDAPRALLDAADAMGRIAHEAGVPFAAVALQHSTRDPRIDSTIVGMRGVDDLDATLALLDVDVPDDLWAAIGAVPLDPSTFQR